METNELTGEELAIWERLVESGRKMRAPLIEAKARANEKAREAGRLEMEAARGSNNRRDPSQWRTKEKAAPLANALEVIPVGVKKFVVARSCGLSFAQAANASGVRWVDVTFAKDRNEEMRCAMAALDECSRDLIRAKAVSIIEQGLEEGARPNHAQMMIAENMLKRLDVDHFGDYQGKKAEIVEDVKKELTGGGFVVNLIGDASGVAAEAPKEKPKKAMVYADV